MRRVRRWSLAFLSAGFWGGAARAAVDTDLAVDAATLSRWFSEQLSNASVFSAAGSLPRPGAVHSVLGVEVGLSGAVTSTKLDIDGFNGLPLLRYDGSTVDIDSRLAVPVPTVHAKVGLPGGFDAGFRFGTLNFEETTNDAKTEFKNRVVGLEVRRRLLGGGLTGVALPDVAIGLSYDRSTGKVDRTENYNGPLAGGGSLVAATRWKSDWDTAALVGRVTVSKNFVVVTPYAGLGFAKYLGDTDTAITIVGTATEPGPVTTNIDQTTTAREEPKSGEALFSAGVEIAVFPLVHVHLGGVASADNWAANVGLVANFR